MMIREIPHLRTSERTAFKRCQQAWQWRYRNGLVTRSVKPDALWFGTGIHLALAERYKHKGTRRGKNVLGVWRDYVGETQGMVKTLPSGEYGVDPGEYVSFLELGEGMLGAYLDHYGKDERWYVISEEQTFEIPIPIPKKSRLNTGSFNRAQLKSGTIVYYNGTFDLVARDQEGDDSLWLWDHKTAASIQTRHLTLDDQAGSYWAVAGDVLSHQGLIKPGEKLDGIQYNFLRKGKPDERPKNKNGQALNKPSKDQYLQALSGYPGVSPKLTIPMLETIATDNDIVVEGEVSKQQPAPLFHREEVWRTASERRTQIERIQNEALQMQAVRSRLLPVIKTPTKDCSWCVFFDMCELHENGDDWQELRDLSFTKQDPYADHRLYTTTEE